MKRYLTGFLAIAIAIASVAFTVPKHKGPLSTFPFHYKLGTFTKPQVETNGNWLSGASLCGGTADKACQIEVATNYTHPDGNVQVLNTTGNVIVIQAVLGAAGTEYVPNPTTSTGIPSATDKP